jgi:hypothetical protein
MDWITLAEASYDDGDEPSGSIKGGRFLNVMSAYELLKNDSLSYIYQISVNKAFH